MPADYDGHGMAGSRGIALPYLTPDPFMEAFPGIEARHGSPRHRARDRGVTSAGRHGNVGAGGEAVRAGSAVPAREGPRSAPAGPAGHRPVNRRAAPGVAA